MLHSEETQFVGFGIRFLVSFNEERSCDHQQPLRFGKHLERKKKKEIRSSSSKKTNRFRHLFDDFEYFNSRGKVVGDEQPVEKRFEGSAQDADVTKETQQLAADAVRERRNDEENEFLIDL